MTVELVELFRHVLSAKLLAAIHLPQELCVLQDLGATRMHLSELRDVIDVAIDGQPQVA